MTLKELRIQKGLTQTECAQYLNVPLRTYIRYEADKLKKDTIKYQYMIAKLNEYGYLDEEHGILTVEQIKKICSKVFENFSVEYAYLFGSYSKGKAKETSDIDLLVSISADGLKFFELVETLRQKLRKKVDLLDVRQLKDNNEFVCEILKDGIKIYG